MNDLFIDNNIFFKNNNLIKKEFNDVWLGGGFEDVEQMEEADLGDPPIINNPTINTEIKVIPDEPVITKVIEPEKPVLTQNLKTQVGDDKKPSFFTPLNVIIIIMLVVIVLMSIYLVFFNRTPDLFLNLFRKKKPKQLAKDKTDTLILSKDDPFELVSQDGGDGDGDDGNHDRKDLLLKPLLRTRHKFKKTRALNISTNSFYSGNTHKAIRSLLSN